MSEGRAGDKWGMGGEWVRDGRRVGGGREGNGKGVRRGWLDGWVHTVNGYVKGG